MRSRGSRTTSYSSAIISTLIPIISTLFGLAPLRTYMDVARRAERAELCWALRRAVLKAFGHGLSPRVALSRARSRPRCLSCLPALKPVPRAMQRATCAVRHATCNMRHAICAVQRAPCNLRRATCAMQRARVGSAGGTAAADPLADPPSASTWRLLLCPMGLLSAPCPAAAAIEAAP